MKLILLNLLSVRLFYLNSDWVVSSSLTLFLARLSRINERSPSSTRLRVISISSLLALKKCISNNDEAYFRKTMF